MGGELLRTKPYIDGGKEHIGTNEETNQDHNEFPQRQVQHAVKYAEPLPEPVSLAPDVECSIPIDESTPIAVAVAETGIIIDPGKRIDGTKTGHTG
jgi:hypothetical protein